MTSSDRSYARYGKFPPLCIKSLSLGILLSAFSSSRSASLRFQVLSFVTFAYYHLWLWNSLLRGNFDWIPLVNGNMFFFFWSPLVKSPYMMVFTLRCKVYKSSRIELPAEADFKLEPKDLKCLNVRTWELKNIYNSFDLLFSYFCVVHPPHFYPFDVRERERGCGFWLRIEY